MEKLDGFFPLYWDSRAGALWMEIARFGTEFLHLEGLAAGLGSNDIGLDRGQLGGSEIVRFQRVGPKILMVQPNYRYRADSDDLDEVSAVTDAFAESVLFSFPVAAETDGRVLVDLTDFLLRDSQNISNRLRPGSYRLDKTRSVLHRPMTAAFPQNSEMEAVLTFVRSGTSTSGQGFRSGRFFEGVGSVAASSEAATLRVHHSFVQLPDSGYELRRFDPRAGYGALSYQDYAVPLGESMTRRFIRRHRLEKVDPGAQVSDPVEPIVYYLDRGTPEPIRSALLDGARWWNQAFEAAGYRNAFRVELLPPNVSPLDVRYNVINWVHRSTRGWSYGGSVTDPRTGEILKGVVTLGSLRVRQDYLIAEGLLSPYAEGDETAPELAEWALARIRQLAAHEVGHTLGLSHNYYDSRQGRISVLDYPHPLVRLRDDGTLDYSEVYDVGIGEWDKVAIQYGYQDFPENTDEDAALAAILNEAWDHDLRFMTNQDLSLHPKVDQWSNGTNAAAELERMLAVRRNALQRFGQNAIKHGTPLAALEEVLVPLYLHHRYQVDAAASVLGGLHYIYAVRGDGRQPLTYASGSEQRSALAALIRTLQPAELALPDAVLQQLPPRPPGYPRTRELFPRFTGARFDAITPAIVAAQHTVETILQDDRAARVVEQHVLQPELPSLQEVLSRMRDVVFGDPPANPYHAEIARSVQAVLVGRMMGLAVSASMPQVQAIVRNELNNIGRRLAASSPGLDETTAGAYARYLSGWIERFLERPEQDFSLPQPPGIPPGAPIGEPALDWLQQTESSCSQPDLKLGSPTEDTEFAQRDTEGRCRQERARSARAVKGH